MQRLACRPSPGYVVTLEEDLGSPKISRPSLPDNTSLLVGDDLLQQLFNPFVVFQTNDNFNGIHSWTMNYKKTKSAMSLLGLGHKSSQSTLLTTILALGNVIGNGHNTGALGLRANHCIYLRSPTLTNHKVVGPAGSRSCLAPIAVNSGYGSILTHQHSGHVLDYIACGGVTLRTLGFDLRNANNEVVDMRGGHVSFSIICSVSPLFKHTKVKCQLH